MTYLPAVTPAATPAIAASVPIAVTVSVAALAAGAVDLDVVNFAADTRAIVVGVALAAGSQLAEFGQAARTDRVGSYFLPPLPLQPPAHEHLL